MVGNVADVRHLSGREVAARTVPRPAADGRTARWRFTGPGANLPPPPCGSRLVRLSKPGPRWSGRTPLSHDHPRRAKAVDAHSEGGREERLAQRHLYLPALAQGAEYALGLTDIG